MTLVHIRHLPCSGIYFCGAGEYCQGFPSLFGLGKLGQAFSSQMSCEHCFSTSISERSNTRRTGRSAERLGRLVCQFISHPGAEDHRKPSRVSGSRPAGKSSHGPKFSCRRGSISTAQNLLLSLSECARGAEGRQ